VTVLGRAGFDACRVPNKVSRSRQLRHLILLVRALPGARLLAEYAVRL